MVSQTADIVSIAMRKAFQLGQKYWSEADSESYRANKRSVETQGKFEDLLEQTRAKVLSQ